MIQTVCPPSEGAAYDLHMRVLALAAVYVFSLACGEQTLVANLADAASPLPAKDVSASTAPTIDDPGPPSQFHGTRCEVEIDGAALPGPGCVSAPMESAGDRTHLFLNFCVSNGEDVCARQGIRAVAYVSLVFAIPGWQEGVVTQAERGRIVVQLADGRRYEAGASASATLPLDFSIVNQNHPTEKDALRATLEVDLPRVEGSGPSVRLRARIN